MTRTSMSHWNPNAPRTAWLTARDPFALMESLFNGEMSRGEELSNRTWAPPVDVRETEESFVVTAELPGLSKDDISITLENNILKLAGERRFERDTKEEEFHRIERSYGSFTRAFSLPSRVTSDNVAAEFKDGILTITVPKAAEARPRRIEIA